MKNHLNRVTIMEKFEALFFFMHFSSWRLGQFIFPILPTEQLPTDELPS